MKDKVMYKKSKRLLDIVGSIMGIFIFAPFFPIISICIKLSSKGPVLFRQVRLGENAKPFMFLKFRTMYVGRNQLVCQELVRDLIAGKYGNFGENSFVKLRKDTRFTPIGKILRLTSLDELPQFFNVLRGDMSLVGPRPPIPYELEKYEEWHKERLSVKPGITGLWQSSGRTNLTFDEMVQLDIEYVRKKSFCLDLKILLRTPWTVISGQADY